MRIQWTIEKKRGNFRPTLSYTIRLETFEKELAVNALSIKSRIPRIPNSQCHVCLPGDDERDASWAPKRYHYISVPSVTYIKDREIQDSIRLPFRESGEYPEIEESFEILRNSYEDIVKQAYSQDPVSGQGEMDIFSENRKNTAAEMLKNSYGDIGKTANSHGPISERGEMDISAETRKLIAARVVGAKFLNLYGNDRIN